MESKDKEFYAQIEGELISNFGNLKEIFDKVIDYFKYDLNIRISFISLKQEFLCLEREKMNDTMPKEKYAELYSVFVAKLLLNLAEHFYLIEN